MKIYMKMQEEKTKERNKIAADFNELFNKRTIVKKVEEKPLDFEEILKKSSISMNSKFL